MMARMLGQLPLPLLPELRESLAALMRDPTTLELFGYGLIGVGSDTARWARPGSCASVWRCGPKRRS